ncbi:MAG: phosphate signaling complex protein PhoU, partial [Proteocatella sp.]
MVREGFDLSLSELKSEVISMMENVNEILEKSVNSLVEQDVATARWVISFDDVIDEQRNDIEERCIDLLALQQPAARDLRILFSILGIVNELERMGDYSVNIAKEVILIGDETHIKPLKDIPKMKNIISEMIKNTIKSFTEEDSKLAYRVGSEDELVDELYKNIYNEILHKVNENAGNISQGTRFLFIGRYLERMGDHLTNICEKIIYIVDGKRVEIN